MSEYSTIFGLDLGDKKSRFAVMLRDSEALKGQRFSAARAATARVAG